MTRHNKTEEELRREVEAKQLKKFLKEYDEMTHALAVKYGYQLVPALQIGSNGISPVFDAVKAKIELNQPSQDEKVATEPNQDEAALTEPNQDEAALTEPNQDEKANPSAS